VFIYFPLAYFDVLLSLYRDNLWIVHPKMKMMSSFAHPPMLLQTCMSFFLLLNTKIILKNVANQTVDSIAIEFQVV